MFAPFKKTYIHRLYSMVDILVWLTYPPELGTCSFPVDCFLGTRKLEILAWEQDEKNLKLIIILVVFPQVAELQRH